MEIALTILSVGLCCGICFWRTAREDKRHKIVRPVYQLPLHLVAPGKSFGEPVDFYPLPGHTPGCSGGEQHELELVEEGEVDGNKSTDTLFCQSTGFVDTPSDAINESTKREDHVCLLIPPSHNNDPFAVQDSVTQEYTTYRPPLPRYTTLPPTNVYPIPQTPSSRRSNNKKDGCNSDDIAEGVLGVAAGVAEIFLND